MNDNLDHLPALNQHCEVCQGPGHVWCMDAGLEKDAGPYFALQDVLLRVIGEWEAHGEVDPNEERGAA